MKQPKLVLLDLDGTIYRGEILIPGSLEFVNKLIEQNVDFRFISNNTSRSNEQTLNKLQSFGLPVTVQNMWSALDATWHFLNQKNIKELFLMALPEVSAEFTDRGFNPISFEPEAVVLCFDLDFHYSKLQQGVHFIQKGIPFIATHPDQFCPTTHGYIPDIACLLAAFKAADCKDPQIIGKPYKTMVTPLLEDLQLKPEDCLVVGDRLYTDIALAVDLSMPSALVLTGEANVEDLHDSSIQPSWVGKDLIVLAEHLGW